MLSPEVINFKPHTGRQARFLASRADIAIYGGAAGGGKTWALLFDPLYWIIRKPTKGFSATIFRRTYPQITAQGGLWDESDTLYRPFGAIPRQSALTWTFPQTGAEIAFRHMENEDSKYDYQGAQIPMIGFDQLESFTDTQFFFMLSRNRSMCGVKPYIRATANPHHGWLADFLGWWLADDGYARLDRIGKLRYMTRDGNSIIWGDTPAEVQAQTGDANSMPKSVTFIPASVYDNPSLLKIDPSYVANLKALPSIDRQRLLGDAKRGGNWKVRIEGGFVKREWFPVVGAAPADGIAVRGWDLAATAKTTADWTVGTRITQKAGIYYIEQPVREKRMPSEVIKLIRHTSGCDGANVQIVIEQEGGSSGKITGAAIVQALAGYSIRPVPVSGDKVTRAMPFLTQAEAGNVRLVGEPNAPWIKDWLNEFCAFPDGDHDDQVDSCSVAFNYLTHGILNPTGPMPDERTGGLTENPVDNDALWQ